jgi:hypothetical protein
VYFNTHSVGVGSYITHCVTYTVRKTLRYLLLLCLRTKKRLLSFAVPTDSSMLLKHFNSYEVPCIIIIFVTSKVACDLHDFIRVDETSL